VDAFRAAVGATGVSAGLEYLTAGLLAGPAPATSAPSECLGSREPG
jgi:hypothetical protein